MSAQPTNHPVVSVLEPSASRERRRRTLDGLATEDPTMTATVLAGRAPDAELMRRTQNGDAEAFGELVDRFGPSAYRIAYGIARSRARAEDIVQEAFLSAWRGRARYSPQRGAVRSWLLSVVCCRAIDELRAEARHTMRRAAGDDLADHLPAPGAGMDAYVTTCESAAGLRRLVHRLPPAQCEAIVLSFYGELTAAETAAALGVPLGTVKGRMRLGLDKLRAQHAA
ncbi:MAG: sigma-70 family RNA polymerase sigma factor [Solirubrobacteraceae bacterium]